MKSSYRSSIPRAAKEQIVKRYPNGEKAEAEYWLAKRRVEVRLFFETGEPELEYGLKDGERHGFKYDWISPGMLISAAPFVDGKCHGTCKQWGNDGRLIGTYRMVRGTGIDLWRQQRDDGTVYLAEVLYFVRGKPEGFEWWLEEDQSGVFIERHWHQGEPHGIYRQWGRTGRLSRGHPKYDVNGQQKTKRQYQAAAALDPTLPPFRPQDNYAARIFPLEIAKHLRP